MFFLVEMEKGQTLQERSNINKSSDKRGCMAYPVPREESDMAEVRAHKEVRNGLKNRWDQISIS